MKHINNYERFKIINEINSANSDIQSDDSKADENIKKYSTLLELLESETFEPTDILNYIGMDKNEYEIPKEFDYRKSEYALKADNDGFTMYTSFENIEYIMNVQNGIFKYLLSYNSSYGAPEYYVDNDELDYLHQYLSDDALKKCEKLAEIFDYDIDVNKEDEIAEMFKYLCITEHFEDFKYDIASVNQDAIIKVVNELLKSLPFNIDDYYRSKDFDCELIFEYDTMVEFIKNNKEDVSTIEEFLESVSNSIDIDYDFEESKYEYITDYKDLNYDFENIIDKYIESPDEIFPKLIQGNNLELFKDKIDMAFFDYKYEIWIDYSKKSYNLIDMALFFRNSITEWMLTNDFKSILKKKVSEDLYEELTEKLLKYEIEISSSKYNL